MMCDCCQTHGLESSELEYCEHCDRDCCQDCMVDAMICRDCYEEGMIR